MAQEIHSPKQGTQAFLDQDTGNTMGRTITSNDGTTDLSLSSSPSPSLLLHQQHDNLAIDEDMDGWSDADRVMELEFQRDLASLQEKTDTRGEKDITSPNSKSVRSDIAEDRG
jgi:hypothetical protein